MLKSSLIKLHAAATLFATRGGCSAKQLADDLRMPVNSIYHLARMPEWEETLDTLGYDGPRKFTVIKTRDAQREAGESVAQARAIYLSERRKGLTHKQAITAASVNVDLDRRRVRRWSLTYSWEEDATE